MDEPREQLAVIRDARLGCGDRGIPWLQFHTYISEGSGAMQIVFWEQAFDIMKKVHRDTDLNGKTCWVDISRPGLITFLRMADI
jgi:hypothetical protein